MVGAAVGGHASRGPAALAAGVGTLAVVAALIVARDPGRGTWMALLVGAVLTALGAKELPTADPRGVRGADDRVEASAISRADDRERQ
jgi:hypothetical protein